jgi:hypothetical protein
VLAVNYFLTAPVAVLELPRRSSADLVVFVLVSLLIAAAAAGAGLLIGQLISHWVAGA